jgi:hypothetical protein
LHNYNEYDNLIQDYFNLQSQKGKQTIYAKYYYDDLIILYCGNYLKYGRLVKNKKYVKDNVALADRNRDYTDAST